MATHPAHGRRLPPGRVDFSIRPRLREGLERAEDFAVMDLMEAEHGAIYPMQDRIDAASAVGGGEPAAAVEEFADALAAHAGTAREETLGALSEPVRTTFLDRFEPRYAAARHRSATAA
ncbi:hypothetical protein AB0O68_04350 [Streptomyces sp. NPDC087512]|uniref:hypothetical protein n=1 Tax=Streptomyces sp. NPDC087512 TaxID=3155059 RepID=UPI0034326530